MQTIGINIAVQKICCSSESRNTNELKQRITRREKRQFKTFEKRTFKSDAFIFTSYYARLPHVRHQ